MKMIIPTCDKYINVLEASKYTFDKYGGEDLDVIVLGFKEPDFDMGSWKFVSLGTDRGTNTLSDDLLVFFKDFNDEFFMLHGDDGVSVDFIDWDLLRDMEDMMKSNPNIMKINITSAAEKHYIGYEMFEDRGSYQYRVVPQTAEYRLSFNSSIWRTSYFKRYCQQGAGYWVWETRGDAKNDGAILLGTTGRHVLDIGHIFRYGNMTISKNWYQSDYTGKQLSNEDMEYSRKIIEKVKKEGK